MADDYRQASLDIWDQMAAAWDDDRRWVYYRFLIPLEEESGQ